MSNTQPPANWRDSFEQGFVPHAEPEFGIELVDMDCYAKSFWDGLSDKEQQARIADHRVGLADGEQDVKRMIEADKQYWASKESNEPGF